MVNLGLMEVFGVSGENGEVGVWIDPLRDGRGEAGGRTNRLLSCRIL